MEEEKKKWTRMAAIAIGFVLAVLLIVMGFQVVQNVFIRAEDIVPRDVVVADVSQNTATLTWATGRETQSVVEYGTSPAALNFFAPESGEVTSHTVQLTLLSPNTTYYFQIRIGDKKFDNGGVPWTFTTKGKDASQPIAVPTEPPQIQPSPTPLPAATATPAPSCPETDCDAIKAKLGKGCSTIDYMRCLKALTPTP